MTCDRQMCNCYVNAIDGLAEETTGDWMMLE